MGGKLPHCVCFALQFLSLVLALRFELLWSRGLPTSVLLFDLSLPLLVLRFELLLGLALPASVLLFDLSLPLLVLNSELLLYLNFPPLRVNLIGCHLWHLLMLLGLAS